MSHDHIRIGLLDRHYQVGEQLDMRPVGRIVESSGCWEISTDGVEPLIRVHEEWEERDARRTKQTIQERMFIPHW